MLLLTRRLWDKLQTQYKKNVTSCCCLVFFFPRSNFDSIFKELFNFAFKCTNMVLANISSFLLNPGGSVVFFFFCCCFFFFFLVLLLCKDSYKICIECLLEVDERQHSSEKSDKNYAININISSCEVSNWEELEDGFQCLELPFPSLPPFLI